MGETEPIRLFGTDGIRSRVGRFPLDRDSLKRLGRVLGRLWEGKKVLLGRDTRESGPDCQRWIVSGMGGTDGLTDVGVIPTPGFSYIMNHSEHDYGIMLTASHNPHFDNGVKIFDFRGEKLPESQEREIEKNFAATPVDGAVAEEEPLPTSDETAKKVLHKLYIDFLREQAEQLEIAGIRCVVDCANGATHGIAPLLFTSPRFEARVFNADPDGRNINQGCGSTHPEALRLELESAGAELGITFDGDGDRVLFMDRRGRLLDGDHALFVMAVFLNGSDPEFNPPVVGTIMTNLGLEKALNEEGIGLVRTAVGDKQVYAEMKRRNAVLGGESSGHIILRHLQRSGDGMLSALYFLKSAEALGMKVEDIWDAVPMFPQETRNIPIVRKRELADWPELDERIAAFEKAHGNRGRVVVRYSGTEPKIRVMMEAQEAGIIEENIEDFVTLLKSNLGE